MVFNYICIVMGKQTKRTALFLSLFAVILCSCGSGAPDTGSSIPLVSGIIDDRTNAYHSMMSGAAAEPYGGICITGSDRAVRHLARKMRFIDCVDNVTGAPGADGLPDFAGETILSFLDTTDAPYSSLLVNGQDRLREIAVRQALLAVDTVYHISPYDQEGRGVKASAKVIVLADACLARFGKSDIDTLFRVFGCDIPVFSPIDILLEEAFAEAEGRDLNVGIVCDKGIESAYRGRFSHFRKKYGAGDSECAVFSLSRSGNPLKDFLDRYLESGRTRPIDVLLVDTPEVKAENMKSSAVDFISLLSGDSVKYGGLLSDSFHIMDSADAVIAACYSFLRVSNNFTHRISMPVCEYFHIGSSGILIHDSYVQN